MERIKSCFCFAIVFLLVSSCDNEMEKLASSTIVVDYPSSTKSLSYNILEEYSFEEITNTKVWSEFMTFEEMMSACNVPDNLLYQLSTDALLLTCLNHPLMFIYTAYNDEFEGIDAICKHSNAFQELITRDNGMISLATFYASNHKVICNTTPGFKNSNDSISITCLNFIELMLAKYIELVPKEVRNNILIPATNYWLNYKVSNPTVFSDFSISKTNCLIHRNVSTKVSGGSLFANCSLYTTFGQTVNGLLLTEMTNSEIAETDYYYIHTYPNATFVSSSTWTYNCHSFAWNVSDGGDICWINNDSNSHLSRYWTNDYYCQTSYPGLCSKIFYYNSDHSAIKLSNTQYESKWGCGPLMEHAPGYGPYQNMSNRYYYREVSVLDELDGNDQTAIGVSNNYYTDIKDNGRFTYSWRIERSNGSETGYSASPNGYTNVVTFNMLGLFTIYCDIYYHGSYVGSQWLEVAVE